jgi:hypothetical protein
MSKQQNEVGPEKRALGERLRQAERLGWIAPSEELAELVASCPYSAEEIDRGLKLLVSDSGLTVGGMLALDQLSDRWLAELLRSFKYGRMAANRKGIAIGRLLDQYSDPPPPMAFADPPSSASHRRVSFVNLGSRHRSRAKDICHRSRAS